MDIKPYAFAGRHAGTARTEKRAMSPTQTLQHILTCIQLAQATGADFDFARCERLIRATLEEEKHAHE